PARRRALRLGVGGVAGLAVGGGALGWIAQRLGGPDTNVMLVAPAEAAVIPERPSFPDIPGLSPEITSASDHYVVDINLVQPSVEAEGWELEVKGLVDRPVTLDFGELQTRFDVVEEFQTLTCISNEVGGDLIGNSAWGGVRLRDVLEAAGVEEGAVDVVFTGDEGYTDSIPLEIALDPSTLLAVSQNGEPLRQEHGFPCRVRVPMIYGMKNVKWLREIEVVDKDYQGYWMQRGWSDEAVIHTGSRIDVAGNDRRASVGEATWIAGVAWAGGRGISKVELSTDDGQTWDEAMLKEPISRYSWTLWAYRWTPERDGTAMVVCRATDGDGEVQTSLTAPPHPAGSTGLHRLGVRVS
ncbi:MAG: molybdopterin-dependent oxidoreductase, partial [Actinomycetota bacterium]